VDVEGTNARQHARVRQITDRRFAAARSSLLSSHKLLAA
jgi:hypothetical protein